MYYLHMTPQPPTTPGAGRNGITASNGPRLLLPPSSRPKSAAPICVPTLLQPTPPPPLQQQRHVPSQLQMTRSPPPRATSVMVVSPRGPTTTSAVAPRSGSVVSPKPVGVLATTTSSTTSTSVQSGSAPHAPSQSTTGSRSSSTSGEPPPPPPAAAAAAEVPPESVVSVSVSAATGNVYQATAARKAAEAHATKLARRLAHFKAQEDKVMRDVQQMKQRLEVLLLTGAQGNNSSSSSHTTTYTGTDLVPTAGGKLMPRRPQSAATSATVASRMAQRQELKTPRSREQLQFLTKQRRVMECRNVELAKLQKQRRLQALESQRMKDAAEQNRRTALKERIRDERQRAIDMRAAKQRHLLDVLEQQHQARLQQEHARELAATRRVEEMKHEEAIMAVRLEALRVHQDHIKRGLESNSNNTNISSSSASSSSSLVRYSPPRSRPASARFAVSPRLENPK